jgi:virginiamycin B lyase
MGKQRGTEVGMRGRGRSLWRGGPGLLALACAFAWSTSTASAAAPVLQHVRATAVGVTTATLLAEIKPEGKATGYQFLYGTADCAATPEACAKAPSPEGKVEGSTSTQHVKVRIEGLGPTTTYHFLLEAHSKEGVVKSDGKAFITYAPPFSGLPDERVYEQASPVDKDAGDVLGIQAIVKATPDGNGITFASTFGVPGGKGNGAFPSYLATRGADSWSTQGLLPPIKYGEHPRVVGWSPDFSKIYARATKLGEPRTDALIEESSIAEEATVIAPYAPKSQYTYAGESADGSVVLFEAHVALAPKPGDPPIPGAVEGNSNLYAWDRTSGEIHLAGVSNEETAPGEGSFAGPYDWVLGTNGFNLHEGGAARSYYLADTHAVAPDGSVYFTAVGTGQLYLRENPTQPQSKVVINEGAEECTEPALACTIHVSASHRTKPDPGGEQPAAFQAASPDGREAYFTSSEELTGDANTGPEQPKASIARDTSDGKAANIEADFIPEKAVGVTIVGSHIYWANPSSGTIGRADLNGEDIKPAFIAVPEAPAGACEEEVENEELEVKEFVPSTPIPAEPRYVAVEGEYVYWTNTGRRDENKNPIDGTGTIGRAKLVGETVEDIEPTFICGEDSSKPKERLISNPQGIAVDETHIYWANASLVEGAFRSIGRAKVDGGEVIGTFVHASNSNTPQGVALSPTHVYFTTNSEGNNDGFVGRAPLAGAPGMGENESHLVGEAGQRGIALDSGHVYWVSQKEGTIGRADLELTTFEKPFIETEGSVNGLAVDAAHLLWSVNGESPKNPGNDLYRFKAPQGVGTGTLADLTPDSNPADKAGADVQGLVAASPDGSHVYVAANGDLDGAGPGGGGTCTRPLHSGHHGHCDLYLLEEGTASLVAPLRLEGGAPDSLNWVGTPVGVFNSGSYSPKTSFLAKDGETLFFQSHEKLSEYDNEGAPELYRYRPGEGTRCLSCRPTGEEAEGAPGLGSISFLGIGPSMAIEGVASRNFSAGGERAFFETAEALSPEDTNGLASCPTFQGYPACLDVYEWEAPGTGSCEEGGPAYSALNEGCLLLISTGKSKFPSLFADASASGEDVFFFTRDGLVGQDGDELQDVYDARVGGGLPSQNEVPPIPCEGIDACHGPEQERQSGGEAASQSFVGPGDPKPKHKKTEKHAKKHKKHSGHKRQGRAGAKGGH